MPSAKSEKKMQIVPNPPQGHTWEALMQLALEEAQKAFLLDEVPVGAVVVAKNGQILARAHNLTRTNNDPSAHAEILALRQAAEKIKNFRILDSYLIVTLEPCIMCLGALREARIEGVVFAVRDKEAGAICSMIDGLELPLKSPKVWYMSNVCEEQARTLLRDFFEHKREEKK